MTEAAALEPIIDMRCAPVAVNPWGQLEVHSEIILTRALQEMVGLFWEARLCRLH